MSTCPVCGAPTAALLCTACGYDGSADLGRYPTFLSLSPGTPAPAHWDLLRCPGCGSVRFGLSRSSGVPVCLVCRQPYPSGQFHHAAPSAARMLTAFAAGMGHWAAAFADGCAASAGDDRHGQCALSDWSSVTAVAVGDSHTAALRRDGTVIAAGNTVGGRCSVQNWSGITAIAAGAYHTIGLRADGTVLTAGFHHPDRQTVRQWSGITAIAAGDTHVAALRSDRTVVAA